MTPSPLHQVEVVIFLLVTVFALTTLAHRLLIPYPILLVTGGLMMAVIPGLPVIQLNPDLVFLIFLPPVLWAAAYFTSWRDFRNNLRPITLLAVGLVLATTAAVAAVAHWLIPQFGWTEAIVLGAIVSPPDAVAATAIGRRLNLPHRLITILEGESLVNDATALVLYRAATGAIVTGSFFFSEALTGFILGPLAGIGVGILVGWVTRHALRWTSESYTEVGVTLLAPYVAWVLAESLHVSGVLACVAGGFYVRRHFSIVVAPLTRLQARAFWSTLVFLLNAVIFILIGLQLGVLRRSVPDGEMLALLGQAFAVSATTIVVRLVWVPLAAYVPRALSSSLRARDPMPSRGPLFIVGWIGMRGIVSLAAALALPLSTMGGQPFPSRDRIILLTFAVIVVTLVPQGLTLGPLIRYLGIRPDDTLVREETHARKQTVQAALKRLDELADLAHVAPAYVEQLRGIYHQRAKHLASGVQDPDHSDEAHAAYRRIRHETLATERQHLLRLRDEGVISDEVMHRLEQELDVEAVRSGVGELKSSSEERSKTKRPT